MAEMQIPCSASLQFAGGVTLQNLTPDPACGSSSDHAAPLLVQEQSSVITHAHGKDIQESLA